MTKKFLLMGLALTTSLSSAFAASGKTADGCSYQIVNGQYLTTCAKTKATSSDQVASAAAAPQAAPQAAAPAPTSYDSVPMRYEPSAPHPSVTQTSLQPETMNVQIATPQNKLVGQKDDREDRDDFSNNNWERGRSRQHQELIDSTYVGAFLGASTMSSVSAGSALGVGLNVGTNIDDNFGFELGYSYSSQDLNLNLDSRASADPLATSTAGYAHQNDATLRSHLFSGEFQGHFTDSFKRLRPYLGAGLGWKASSVEENTISNSYGPAATSGGTLSQNTLGGIASAGVKFRISNAFNFGAAFKYFMPILHQNSKLEQPQSNYSGYGVYPTAAETRLTKADDALTGSGQYQILGGLQYLF
ncbi:MAG: outer membrane beta-barrel protein [Bdellovibrionota bacterium]